MEKLKINEVIVVEGRDDTAAVSRAVDAVTIETHGFGMSESMWKKIDAAYKAKGIIVLTDPDYAGENIRRKILAKYPDAKQAFLAVDKATKKGDIGIENAKPEDIRDALLKAHCTEGSVSEEFTMRDMEEYGLCGNSDSKERRIKLGDMLGIGYGNSKTFLKKLNQFGIEREKVLEKIKEL